MRSTSRFALFLILGPSMPAIADCVAPAWAGSNRIHREGSIVTVSCEGAGATQELSGIEARDRCDSQAALEYRQTVNVKELVVSTDKDSAMHREVAAETCLVGVTCHDPMEMVCENDGSTRTWRRCTYHMAEIREGSPTECRDLNSSQKSVASGDAVSNRSSLGQINQKVKVKDAGRYERGENYVLRVSVVPACDDIVINGSSGRRLQCKTNPVNVPVRSSDRELIIRAKGYLPKTIQLNQQGGVESHVSVYLDSAD